MLSSDHRLFNLPATTLPPPAEPRIELDSTSSTLMKLLLSMSSVREPRMLPLKISLLNKIQSPRPETISSPSTSFAKLNTKKMSKKPLLLMYQQNAQLSSTSQSLRLSLSTKLPSLPRRSVMLLVVLHSDKQDSSALELMETPLTHSSSHPVVSHLEMVSLSLEKTAVENGALPQMTLIMVTTSVDSVVDSVATMGLPASVESVSLALKELPSPQSLPREPSVSEFQRLSSKTTSSPSKLIAPSRKSRLLSRPSPRPEKSHALRPSTTRPLLLRISQEPTSSMLLKPSMSPHRDRELTQSLEMLPQEDSRMPQPAPSKPAELTQPDNKTN